MYKDINIKVCEYKNVALKGSVHVLRQSSPFILEAVIIVENSALNLANILRFLGLSCICCKDFGLFGLY